MKTKKKCVEASLNFQCKFIFYKCYDGNGIMLFYNSVFVRIFKKSYLQLQVSFCFVAVTFSFFAVRQLQTQSSV